MVDYVNRSYVTKVPVKRKVIEYQQVAETELVPHERVTTDYYAVERQVHYIKDFVTETKLEYVPKEHKVKRYEYIPV